MVKVTINIPADKISRVITAYKGLYEIPLDKDENPIYTDQDWAKEQIRMEIVRKVQLWEERERRRNEVGMDDSIATLE